MSQVGKQSGAKKRKIKREQLIKEMASRPGQLKISNIFKSSVELNCRANSPIKRYVSVHDPVVHEHVHPMEGTI